jgi:hypothetical protein
MKIIKNNYGKLSRGFVATGNTSIKKRALTSISWVVWKRGRLKNAFL